MISGISSLDRIVGDIPKGHIVEVFGEPACGKTTLAYHYMANAGNCAFIDSDHSFNPVYAKRVGVDVENLIVCRPHSGVLTFSLIELLLSTNDIDLIVVDSIASLHIPDSVSMYNFLSNNLSGLVSSVNGSNSVVLLTNQIRRNITMRKDVVVGGSSIPSVASARINLINGKKIRKRLDQIGNKVTAVTVKNRFHGPFEKAQLSLIYGKGFVL